MVSMYFKIAATVVLAVSPSVASATNWIISTSTETTAKLNGKPEKTLFLIDRDSLKVDRVWTYVINLTVARKSLMKADCGEDRYKPLYDKAEFPDGHIEMVPLNDAWIYAEPGTPAGDIVKFICSSGKSDNSTNNSLGADNPIPIVRKFLIGQKGGTGQ